MALHQDHQYVDQVVCVSLWPFCFCAKNTSAVCKYLKIHDSHVACTNWLYATHKHSLFRVCIVYHTHMHTYAQRHNNVGKGYFGTCLMFHFRE